MGNSDSRGAFEKMGQLVKFLLGEDAYMGLQFGDSVKYGRTQARFWWRNDLRKLWDSVQARQPEIDALKARIAELELEATAQADDEDTTITLLEMQNAELKQRIAELEKAEWYCDSDGEYSGIDPSDIAEKMDLGVGGIKAVHGAREVSVKYVAHIAISYDDDGDFDESEYQVFSTKEEAQQAVDAMPKPPAEAAKGGE